MCENLVRVATTIGKLQHLEYLKPPSLDTCEWAIRPVFPETVTYNQSYTSCWDTVDIVASNIDSLQHIDTYINLPSNLSSNQNFLSIMSLANLQKYTNNDTTTVVPTEPIP